MDFHYSNGVTHDPSSIADLYALFTHKMVWFAKNGYQPHYWQVLFHTNNYDDKLIRFRHLVAGRRGGKTLSAAWELMFYLLHPEIFHWDAHRKRSGQPLNAWILTPDHANTGMAALQAIRLVIEQCGLTVEQVKENRGNRWFEFHNGSFLQFKTAENPEMLRGAGLDILWMDEGAFIPSARPWEVSRPTIADRMGLLITTTTPSGKNWFYNTFWSPEAKSSPNQGRVEYRSIDNPHFDKEEWKELQRTMHPMLFKQEFMASFDSMAGRELHGDWLKYYELPELERYKNRDGQYEGLDVYVAVDPAISLADAADRFAITAIGVTKDRRQVYLLEQWAGKIPFPEQVEKIYEWFILYSPKFIGIEKVAYQEALAQQVARLQGFPPVVPLFSKGKKFMRILAMAPQFRIGRVKIRREHIDFIDEWIDYDSTLRNPHDDCLDSMEMALRTAGILIPGQSLVDNFEQDWGALTADDFQDLAKRKSPKIILANDRGVDEHLGADW